MTETKNDTGRTETVTLTNPIPAHGEDVNELTFREPTGSDISQCGVPFTLLPDGGVIQPDAAALRKMMSRLAGVPPSSIDKLVAVDWMKCMGAVLDFFGDSVST